MKKFKNYKESGIDFVGIIPTHWRVEKIKWLFAEINRRNRDLLYNENNLLSVSEYYGVGRKSERIKEDDILNRSETLEENKIVAEDDLVINIMLAWKKAMGVSEYKGIVSGAYCVYRLTDKESVPKFFHYLFRTELYAELFRQNSTGIIDSRLRLYTEEFFSLYVPVPPKEEQFKIVMFLDNKIELIEGAIEKKQHLIEYLEEEKAAIVNHAVTRGIDETTLMSPSGIEWLGDVPAHWRIQKLKYVLKSVRGGGTPSTDEPSYWNGHIPWVSPKDMKVEKILTVTQDYVTELAIKNSSTALIPAGGILFVVRSGILKHTFPLAINEVPVTLNQDMKAIEPEEHILRDFLFWLLKGSGNAILTVCRKQGATVDSIEMEYLLNFTIAYPKIEEQRKIVTSIEHQLSKIDQAICKIEKEMTLLSEYKTSIIHEVVTGKVTVEPLAGKLSEAKLTL